MTLSELISRLTQSNDEGAISLGDLILESLRENTVPAWILESSKRLLTPWIKDRVSFAYNDPKQYGNGANPDVFGKFLQHLADPNGFSENSMIKLLETFVRKCTKQEWLLVYKPILTRTASLGNLTVGQHNTLVLYPYTIHMFDLPECVIGNPEPDESGFFYEFHDNYDRAYVIIWEHCTECVNENFELWPFPEITEPIDQLRPSLIKFPLIFEVYTDGFDCHFVDVFELDKIDIWPGEFRRRILETAIMNIDDEYGRIILGEGFPGSFDDIDRVIEHFQSITYGDGKNEINYMLLFKDAKQTYQFRNIIIPTIPLKMGLKQSPATTKSHLHKSMKDNTL